MSNLSRTGGSAISGIIGALEFGETATSRGDSTAFCPRIDDDVLLRAAGSAQPTKFQCGLYPTQQC